MNRNAISRLIEVSLFAGIAISLAGAASVFAQQAPVAKPAVAASKQAGHPAMPPTRPKVATQKLMRNPWEKSVDVASTQSRAR